MFFLLQLMLAIGKLWDSPADPIIIDDGGFASW
jgi:hypothetical protein